MVQVRFRGDNVMGTIAIGITMLRCVGGGGRRGESQEWFAQPCCRYCCCCSGGPAAVRGRRLSVHQEQCTPTRAHAHVMPAGGQRMACVVRCCAVCNGKGTHLTPPLPACRAVLWAARPTRCALLYVSLCRGMPNGRLGTQSIRVCAGCAFSIRASPKRLCCGSSFALRPPPPRYLRTTRPACRSSSVHRSWSA